METVSVLLDSDMPGPGCLVGRPPNKLCIRGLMHSLLCSRVFAAIDRRSEAMDMAAGL